MSAVVVYLVLSPRHEEARQEVKPEDVQPEDTKKLTLLTPDPSDYKILYRTKNRALMQYGGYIYYMRPGDMLPNGKPMNDFDNGEELAARADS